MCVCVCRPLGVHSFVSCSVMTCKTSAVPEADGPAQCRIAPDNANNVSCMLIPNHACAHTGLLRECRVSSISRGVLARASGMRGPKDGVERVTEVDRAANCGLAGLSHPCVDFKFVI